MKGQKTAKLAEGDRNGLSQCQAADGLIAGAATTQLVKDDLRGWPLFKQAAPFCLVVVGAPAGDGNDDGADAFRRSGEATPFGSGAASTSISVLEGVPAFAAQETVSASASMQICTSCQQSGTTFDVCMKPRMRQFGAQGQS